MPDTTDIEPFTADGPKVMRNGCTIATFNPRNRHAPAFAVLVAIALNTHMKEILHDHV